MNITIKKKNILYLAAILLLGFGGVFLVDKFTPASAGGHEETATKMMDEIASVDLSKDIEKQLTVVRERQRDSWAAMFVGIAGVDAEIESIEVIETKLYDEDVPELGVLVTAKVTVRRNGQTDSFELRTAMLEDNDGVWRFGSIIP